MDHVEKTKRKPHPEESANLLSVLTFFYSLKLFRKGLKKDLQGDDLYEVLSRLKSQKIGDQLEKEWDEQQRKGKSLSIVRLMWACYGWKYLLLGVMQMCVRTIVILIQPMALGKVVGYFDPGQTELSTYDAYYYASLLIGLNLLHCLYYHNYLLSVTSLGIQVKTAFCSYIYRKALKLSPTRLADISVGKVVTLITKDVNSFDAFIHFANDIWIGLVQTGVICYVVYRKIGIAAVAGVGFFFIVMPLQILCGVVAAKLRIRMCKRADERLQITQEVLSAIRIIKMYTWERFFYNKVSQTRKREIASMHYTFYLRFIVLVIGGINSKVAFYVLIMTYIWLGNHITAELVYFILNCFNMLYYTLSVLFPIGIAQSAELFASIKRIGNVLRAMEIQAQPQNANMTIKPKIILNNVTVHFKDRDILQDINLNLNMGLTLITGPVGSGKSFLLKTILQDFQPSKGNLETHGRISYASQEPWLFPSSIKQNIIFGEVYDEKRYQEALRVCALTYDLDLLEAGDSTIVEDRGANLSRGQQARVNLARAVYKDAEIYLLDDCLSALDAHVSDLIFRECIVKYLRNKLVLLVTHNTSHVKDVDNVVIVHSGQIKSFTKSSELTETELKNIENKEKIVKGDDDPIEDADEGNEDAKLIPKTPTDRKVYHEIKKEGEVDWEVHKQYIKFGGGYILFLLVFMIFVAAQFALSYTEKLLSKWVNVETQLSNYTMNNITNGTDYEQTMGTRNYMLNLYTVITVSTAVLTLGRSLCLFAFARRASICLHKYMISHVINATMHFFDTNFIGNILNRFSKDLSTIDDTIPFVFYHFYSSFLFQAGIIILIATVNSFFLIPTAVFFLILTLFRWIYIPTGRSLKRLDASTRSPVVGHLNATLEGLTTIRAFKAQKILKDEFDRHQDLYTSATYGMQCSMRAFAYYLDTLCSLFIACIVVTFLVLDNESLPGNVGLAISSAFMMTGSLQWAIRQWAEIENQMTSVERVLEYTVVKQENQQGLILEDWPSRGEVKYERVCLTYTNSTEQVLKDITFMAHPKEKIGIVGRTGAGKSSIISTLFRLYEVQGKIMVDGVDIKTLALDFLRSKISIIPQDPVLFMGTIRDNIDPLSNYSDQQIWHAIEQAHLKKLVPSLDLEISENGVNFSVGQRQLICLARAIVRNNKIIVLDEATANMDHETDALIHDTIDANFASCTVITVAHKLQTILKSDKVMVMDQGRIIEFDSPSVLLAHKDGDFYKMVAKAGLLPKK